MIAILSALMCQHILLITFFVYSEIKLNATRHL